MSIGIILWDFRGHGVARVVTHLLPIFKRMGIRVVVMTGGKPEDDLFELPLWVNRVCIGYGKGRQDKLKETLIKNKVEVVVDHEYYAYGRIQEDMRTARECGAKFVVHHHNVFSSALVACERRPLFTRLIKFYSDVDAIITLSRVDACYFKVLGCRAFYIQNPSAICAPEITASSKSCSDIAWIGRITPIKRLEDAIEIIRIVLQRFPYAKLHVFGAGGKKYVASIARLVRNDDALSKSVVFEGFIADIEERLNSFGLLLMTSAHEGDPCVVVEAKSQGLPVVCYDLPYAETVRDRGGIVAVPQMDRQAAADAVVKLLSNQKYYQQMSEAARASYEQMRSYDHEKRYRQFFDYLKTGIDPEGEPDLEDYRIALRTLTAHAGAAVDELVSKDYLKRRIWAAICLRLSVFMRPFGICKKICRQIRSKR